jgi:hypothetical protein
LPNVLIGVNTAACEIPGINDTASQALAKATSDRNGMTVSLEGPIHGGQPPCLFVMSLS